MQRILGQMARFYYLRELAEHLGVGIDAVVISCFYCGRYLTHGDRVLFAHAQLQLVCRDGFHQAACQLCIRTLARLDFVSHYEKFISTQEAAELAEKQFTEISVRCYACLRLLNTVEKCDVVSSGGDVAVIKGTFRALCTLCKIGLP